MAIPERIDPRHLADYFEVMSKAIFQAGMRWSVIDKKWPDFRRAFANFDPAVVAKFSPAQIARLSDDPSIIRSHSKISATVNNAKTLLAIDEEFQGFANYLHSFQSYKSLAQDLHKRFKYMGELNAYYLLFRVQEPVPPFEEWVQTIPGEHPRIREMVQLAQEQDRRRQSG